MVVHVGYDPQKRRAYYERNKQASLNYSRVYHLQRKFNLSPDEYKKKLESQGGVCAICKNECTRALAVDHNHITGQVRGLLCNKCNRGIGYLSDSIDLLQASIDYLNEYKIDGV